MKVYITSFVPETSLNILQSAGWEILYEPTAQNKDVLTKLGEVDGVIINTKTPLGKDALHNNPHLKFIGRLGSGLDIIDLDVAKYHGIKVFNSPEGNCNAVAEHALGMILAFYNKLIDSDRMVRGSSWNRESMRGEEIGAKTFGIVGLGHTGSALAKKLTGFGSRILYYDPYISNEISLPSMKKVNSIEELGSNCDIISFHVPLTPETLFMGNDRFFTFCKKKPLIVNTSRGKVVNTIQLVSALESGIICGACLDVFENEKPETYNPKEQEIYSALFSRSDVILTPHVAGWSRYSKFALSEILFDKILQSFQ